MADLSELRKKLIEIYQGSLEELGPFLSDRPMIRGTVYPLRRKCAKSWCRCARGERHETVVLTANIGGKTRLWTLPEERRDEVRTQAEQYRQFRKARARLMKTLGRRQREMLRLIDAIGKIRIQTP